MIKYIIIQNDMGDKFMKKRIIIWLASMTAIILIVNTLGGFFIKFLAGDDLALSLSGYSKKVESFIHPELIENPGLDKNGKRKNNGLGTLMVRSVLSDVRLSMNNSLASTIVFANFHMDQVGIFFDENGTNELSEGIFAAVYKEEENVWNLRNIAGVVKVNDFCKLNGSKEIHKYTKEKDIKIRIDSYTISDNYVITPNEITIIDSSNNEILKKSFNIEGELHKADNIYFYDCEDLYQNMSDAYRGENKANEIARELMDTVVFNNVNQEESDYHLGLGTLTMTRVETTDNNAFVYVLRFNYIKCVIFYAVLFGIYIIVIMILASKVVKKKKITNTYYY